MGHSYSAARPLPVSAKRRCCPLAAFKHPSATPSRLTKNRPLRAQWALGDCQSEQLFWRRTAFNDVACAGLLHAQWAVAYVTAKGSCRIHNHLAHLIGSDGWRRTQKTLVTCFDYGITEPSALRYLMDEAGFAVLIHDVAVLERSRLRPLCAFHPKGYFFVYSDRAAAVIGSANLTEAALVSNTEIVCVSHELTIDACNSLWERICAGTTRLDNELLGAYDMRRSKMPADGNVVESEPEPGVEVGAAEVPVLWHELEGGRVRPDEYNQSWIEAGSMSSGGSHNQLELPRGANRFFGFRFTDYGNDNETIGNPPLLAGHRTWTNRPLTWHGNNRMERLNLPTRAQGGLNYPGTAILFRRRPDGFDLSVMAWNDPAAVSWRRASIQAGRVFRLGDKSNRICGLF